MNRRAAGGAPRPWKPANAILGAPFEPVTVNEAAERIDSMVASGRPHQVVTANVDFLAQARHDAELRRILLEAQLVLCDDARLIWVSQLLGNPLPERVAGTDLVPRLLRIAARKGYRVFFLGGASEVTRHAVANLRAQLPQLRIAGHYSPPFRDLLLMDHEEILTRIQAARPDILLVSFSCPKAGKWIAMHNHTLGIPVAMGIGSTIDFLANPVAGGRAGWLFRLLQEPHQLVWHHTTALCRLAPAILQQWWQTQACAPPPRPGAPGAVLRREAAWEHVQMPERLDCRAVRRNAETWACLGNRPCLLDMQPVQFMDSTGAALLLQLRKRLRQAGQALVLLAPGAGVRRTLTLMRLLGCFAIAEDAFEARQIIQPDRQPPAMPPPSTACASSAGQAPARAAQAPQPQPHARSGVAESLAHRTLRIGLSTSVMERGQTGVGQYVLELVRALMHHTGGHEFVLFVLEQDLPLFAFAEPRMLLVPVPERFRSPWWDFVWHQVHLPELARRLRLDVLHVPSPRRLLWPRPCPLVGTIHDLAHFRIPGRHDWRRAFYGRTIAPQLVRRQDRLIAVSNNTAHDMDTFFDVPQERVTVVYNGVDHGRFFPTSSRQAKAAVALSHGVRTPFFLCVARLEHPAKNHLRLIQAFTRFKSAHVSPWQLVLAGRDDKEATVIHAAARRSPAAAAIRCLGFVPHRQLPTLLRAADAFVYPSLYAGFGMPPLEAMACGCPVICSDGGALREVVGDAGLLVNPEDVAELTACMTRLADDTDLRARCQKAGLAWARRFDWHTTAAATLEVYAMAART